MDERTYAAIERLVASDESAIRVMARRDLLNEPAGDGADHILDGAKVRALFSEQQPDGGFGKYAYRKYTGVHWRLVSLVEIIDARWLDLRYPPYWHYDVLQSLLVLSRMSPATDARAAEAIAVIEERRLADGRWRPRGYWWKPPGSSGSGVDVVDWGRAGPKEMITLNSLRVLEAAGRLN